jgi:hypothetical protein
MSTGKSNQALSLSPSSCHLDLSQRSATSFLERDVFHTPGYASLIKHSRSRRGAQWARMQLAGCG